MRRSFGIVGTILLIGLSDYAMAADLAVEVRMDRASAKAFAKDAAASTATFRIYLDETCSGPSMDAIVPLGSVDRVARVKNESLKNDPTPAPKEEWVLSADVSLADLSESEVVFAANGNVFVTVTLDNGSTPVVSTCQRQKFLEIASECGNGVALPSDECDGSDLNGQTCSSQGFFVGSLGCTAGCEFDTSNCHSTCPGAGVALQGACWYLGPQVPGSCTDTCAAQGLTYSELTRTYAGSDGTLAQCFAVLDALGFTSPPALDSGDTSSTAPVGCSYEPGGSGFRQRVINPAPTTANADSGARRVCACE
jgi:hypothetical protein